MIEIAIGAALFACALSGVLARLVWWHNREIVAHRILITKLIVDTEQNAAVNLDLMGQLRVMKDRVAFLEHQANGGTGMHEESGNLYPGPQCLNCNAYSKLCKKPDCPFAFTRGDKG